MRRAAWNSIIAPILGLLVVGVWANDSPVSLAGTWETTHPLPETGSVLVHFDPTDTMVEYAGDVYPAYDVSVWQQSNASVRKLRDGLFGEFTRASVVPGEHGPLLLWTSSGGAGDRRNAYNPIVSIEPARRIGLGPDGETDAGPARVVLSRIDDGVVAERDYSALDLPGIYRFRHVETGDVFVRFSATDLRLSVDDGEMETFAVSALSAVGDLGYTEVHNGLFGGSFADDRYPYVGVHADSDGLWLDWRNPAARLRRRMRVVALYPNGDIGVALDDGESRYREAAVFRRVAGPDALVAPHEQIIPLEGRFSTDFGDELVAVQIESTSLRLGGSDGPILRAIHAVDPNSGAVTHAGVFPGDPFTHVAVQTEDGEGYLVWYSFAHDIAERSQLVEPTGNGFVTVGRSAGARYPIARFTRIAPSTPGSSGLLTGPSDGPPRDAVAIAVREAKRRLAALLPSELTEQVRATLSALEPTVPLLPDGIADPVTVLTTRFEREFVEMLALSYYASLTSSVRTEWRRFSLWQSDGDSQTARNVSAAGYAHQRGMLSPALDFATSVVEHFLPPPYRDPMGAMRHRLPDRSTFIEGLFGPPTLAAWQTPVAPQTVAAWIDPEDVEWIELIVTTPTASAPESLAGHLVLVIRRHGDHVDGRDSIALGFVGVTFDDIMNGVGALTYAWRGITGHYRTAVAQETLGSVAERATLLEDRDVQRLRLNLHRSEIARLIERLWVVQRTFEYGYRFFDVNCASMLLDVLNHALAPDRRVAVNVPAVPPLYVAARLGESGLIDGPVYPEFWSIERNARVSAASNSKIERELLARLNAQVADGVLAATTRDEIRRLFDLTRTPSTVRIESDLLFREPLVTAGSPARSWAYARLGSVFAGIYRGDDGVADLFLRYLSNAFDVELYLAVPSESDRTGLHRRTVHHGAMMVEVPPEQIRAKLLEVQRRERNSLEIQGVRLAQSTYRLALAEKGAGDWIYGVANDVRFERFEELERVHRRSGRGHGYFPLIITTALDAHDDATRIALGVGTAVFDEPLGLASRYALRPAMRLALMVAGLRATADVSSGLSTWGDGRNTFDLHATAVEYQLVRTGRGPEYTGYLNHGIGVTIGDAVMSVPDVEPFGNVSATVRALEAAYLLNVLETRNFRSYVNLSAGAAWIIDWSRSALSHGAGFPLALVAKAQTLPDTAVRLGVEYEPTFGRGVSQTPGITTTIDLEWTRSNTLIRGRASASW